MQSACAVELKASDAATIDTIGLMVMSPQLVLRKIIGFADRKPSTVRSHTVRAPHRSALSIACELRVAKLKVEMPHWTELSVERLSFPAAH